MSEVAQQIAEVELGIEHAKTLVEKAAAIRRLALNPDFQKIIEKDFFEGEAIRLTHLVSDPQISEDVREKVKTDLMSVGFLKRFLSVTVQMGDQAEQAIIADENELDILRSEEAEYEEEGDDA